MFLQINEKRWSVYGKRWSIYKSGGAFRKRAGTFSKRGGGNLGKEVVTLRKEVGHLQNRWSTYERDGAFRKRDRGDEVAEGRDPTSVRG